MNNGKCIDRVGSYECVCEDGWTGQNCEKEVEMCSGAICKNDANCINLFQDYFCVCPKGTDGKQCEVRNLESFSFVQSKEYLDYKLAIFVRYV